MRKNIDSAMIILEDLLDFKLSYRTEKKKKSHRTSNFQACFILLKIILLPQI